jgi:hypothetical protein
VAKKPTGIYGVIYPITIDRYIFGYAFLFCQGCHTCHGKNKIVSNSFIITSICLTFITFLLHLFIIKKLIAVFYMRGFFVNVMLPYCVVTVVSAIIPVFLSIELDAGLLRLCLVTGTSILSVCISIYMIGLNKQERLSVNSMIINRIRGVLK